MIRSPEIDKLATALAKAQGLIEDADKDSTNPHFKSKYSDFSSIRAVVRKPLSDNGLAYVQLPRTVDKGVEVETILMHESGQMIGETLFMPAQGMTAQAIGSALTYAKRYGLMAIVGLAASEDDDDGNAATRAKPVQHRQAPPEPQADPSPFDEPQQPSLSDLTAMGIEAADRGSNILKTWWENRTAEERRVVGKTAIEAWKLRAVQADMAERAMA